MSLEQLRADYKKVSDELKTLNDKCMAEAKAASAAVYAKYNPELMRLSDAEYKARLEMWDEESRVKAEDAVKLLPYPEGTVLVEWYRPILDNPFTAGKKAVLEVFRRGNAKVKGAYKYGWYAEPGEIVLRYLKADGKSIGVKGEPWKPNFTNTRWFPEGQNPNEKN